MATTPTGFRITILTGGNVHDVQGGFEVTPSRADVEMLVFLLSAHKDYQQAFERLAAEYAVAEWVMPERTQALVGPPATPRCSICGAATSTLVIRHGDAICPACAR